MTQISAPHRALLHALGRWPRQHANPPAASGYPLVRRVLASLLGVRLPQRPASVTQTQEEAGYAAGAAEATSGPDLISDLRNVLAALPDRLPTPGEVTREGEFLRVRLSAELVDSVPGLRLSLSVGSASGFLGTQGSGLAGLRGIPLLISEPGRTAQLFRLVDGEATVLMSPDDAYRIRVPRTVDAGGLVLAEAAQTGPVLPADVAVAGSRRRYVRQEIHVEPGSFTITFFEDESGELRVSARGPGETSLGTFVLLAGPAGHDRGAAELVIPLAGLDAVGRATGTLNLGAAHRTSSWFVSPALIRDPGQISGPALARSAEMAGDQDARELLRRAIARRLG
jgi:hypothetical protein